jgi:hypothetical protein
MSVKVTFTHTCILCGAEDSTTSEVDPGDRLRDPYNLIPPQWCVLAGFYFCLRHKMAITADGEPLKWTPDGKPYV